MKADARLGADDNVGDTHAAERRRSSAAAPRSADARAARAALELR